MNDAQILTELFGKGTYFDRSQSLMKRFVRLFQKTEQLAKSFIDVYGTKGSIKHTFADYDSLKQSVLNARIRLSDDAWYELQFQYKNMTD